MSWALEHPWMTFFIALGALSCLSEWAHAVAKPRCLDCRRNRIEERP